LNSGEKQSWDFEIFAADDLNPELDGLVIGLASDAPWLRRTGDKGFLVRQPTPPK